MDEFIVHHVKESNGNEFGNSLIVATLLSAISFSTKRLLLALEEEFLTQLNSKTNTFKENYYYIV